MNNLDWIFRIKDYMSPGLAKVNQGIEKTMAVTEKAEARASGMMAKVGGASSRFAMKNAEVIDGVAHAIPGGGQMMALITNPYVAAGAAAVALGTASYNASQQWAKGMAEVNVTAQLSQSELKGVSDRVLDIASRAKVPLQSVPDALNRIISAGLDMPHALESLEPTLKAAKAGFTDVGIAAAAGVSVMNSSGVQDITRVYDILFATLNKGNAKFEDITQYLPKIIPQARNVGISLEQVAGSWAYLTAQGQTAERATTLLENAMKALSNPDRIAAFEKMGVAIFDQGGKMMPIVKIADQLSGKLAGLSDKDKSLKLASLGLDGEASAAFAAMSQNVAKLGENIDFVTNSTGQLNKAVENAKTPGDKWIEISNRVGRGFVKIGQFISPLVDKVGDFVNYTIDKISALANWIVNSPLYKAVSSLANLLGPVLSGTLKGLAWAWEKSWGLMAKAMDVVMWPLQKVMDGLSWVGEKLGIIEGKTGDFYKKEDEKLKGMQNAGGFNDEVRRTLEARYDQLPGIKLAMSKADYVAMKMKGFAQVPDPATATSPATGPTAPPVMDMVQKKSDKMNETAIAGGQQIKNFTVTINDGLVNGLVVQNTTNQPMDASLLERLVSQALMRAVRDVEVGFSS